VPRDIFAIVIAAILSLAVAAPADAGHWPERPVRVIVPFAAGGYTDGIGRITSEWLADRLGQSFVVENLLGAGGVIASKALARAPADGYTIMMTTLPQVAIAPALEDVPYNPLKDFAPISNVASAPFVLMVNAGVPVKTLKEFIDYVHARPGQLTFASASAGSQSHFTMVMLIKRAGLDMVHVPYKGGALAMIDLAAGRVTAYFGTRTDAVEQAQSGMIRLLAVSGDERSPQFPDVPTVAESGYPGFRSIAWNGLTAPAGTPVSAIDTLAGEVKRATQDEGFVRKLANIGADPIGDDPQHFAATIAADIPLWADVVRQSEVKQQ
jgi:tripartite-type tricarboxylate transporter receptor subunit TctC